MNLICRYGVFIFLLIMQILNGSNNSESPSSISLGISKSYDINPFTSNRLYIQSSISFKSLPGNYNYQYYPDIGFGYKVSKNLALEGSVFNYSLGGFSDQIIRGGIQYYFGSSDTLSWVSSLKKVSYRSMKNFNLNNLTLEFSKWINYKHNFFRFGFGSNFYTRDNFLYKQRGQINFILLSTIIPVNFFQLSFETKMNLHTFFYSFSLLKDFH